MAEGIMADDFAPFQLCADLVSCSICYEPFTESRVPKALACLHSFCITCLRSTIKAHIKNTMTNPRVPPERRKAPSDFPCPVCKERIRIPQNGVAGFRDDFRIQMIKDLIVKSRDAFNKKTSSQSGCAEGDATHRSVSRLACGICKTALSGDTVLNYCLECFKLLCTDCLRGHGVSGLTRDHKIVELPQTVPVNSLPMASTCDLHTAEPLRYYCKSCRCPVCVACTMSGSHGGHDVSRLPEEARAVREEATSILETAKEHLRKAERDTATLQTLQNELREKEQSVRKAILSKTLDDIVKAKQRQVKMEKDLESMCKEKYAELEKQTTKLSGSSSRMQSRCKFMADLLEHGQDLQVINLTSVVLQQLRGDDCDRDHLPDDYSRTVTKLGRYDSLLQELELRDKNIQDLSPASVLSEIKDVVSEIRDLSLDKPVQKNGDSRPSTDSPNRLSDRKRRDANGAVIVGKRGVREGEFSFPSGIAFLSGDDFAVTDMHNHRIQIFNKNGDLKKAFGHGQMKPSDIAVTRDGWLAVTDCCTGDSSIKVFTTDGVLKSSVGAGMLKYPFSIAIDTKDRFVVCDTSTNTITLLKRSGEQVRRFDTRTKFAFYLSVNHRNEILLSDWFNQCVKVFDTGGILLRKIGGVGTEDGQLMIPLGLCTDNVGNVLVLDCKCERVTMFSPEGRFIRHVLQKSRFEDIRHARAVAISAGGVLALTSGDTKGQVPNEIRLFDIGRI